MSITLRTSILFSLPLLAMFSLAAPTRARADEAETKKLSVGGDAVFALPVGNLADGAGVGFGALGKLEFRATPNVSLTGRVGFVYHVAKSAGDVSVGLSEIPIWIGGRFYFMGGSTGAYGAVEAGPTVLMARSSGTVLGTPVSGSNSETKFGATLGGGFQLDALDLRAGLAFLDLGHAGDSMTVLVSVGYNFAAF